MSRSTITNLQTPQIGRPLRHSWCKAVTDNLNREELTPGAFTDGATCIHSAPAPYVNPLMLRVKNMTEVQLPMFSVLMVTEPWITDNAAFPQLLRTQQNELLGHIPDGSCHEKVAITSYVAPPGNVVPCVVSGPTPVQIKFPDKDSLDYPFARPIDGDYTQLIASPYGKIAIIWHEEPEVEQEGCDERTLWSWVNMGEKQEWMWFVLQEDLDECGSALALPSDECGAIIGECPIQVEVYGPKSIHLCGCETTSGKSWRAGDVVPAMWYEYLCRWITIPCYTADFEEKEAKLITTDALNELEIEFTYQDEENPEFVTDVDFTKVALKVDENTDVPIEASGTVTVDGKVNLSDEISIKNGSLTLGKLQASGNSTAGLTIAESPVEVSGSLELGGEVELKYDEANKIDVVTGVEYTPPTIKGTVNVNEYKYASINTTGSLIEDGATLQRGVTFSNLNTTNLTKTQTLSISSVPASVVTDVQFNATALVYEKATGVSLSLNSIKIKQPKTTSTEIITDIEWDKTNCEFKVTKGTVDIVTEWEEVTIPLTGAATLSHEFESVSDSEGAAISAITSSTTSSATTFQVVDEDKLKSVLSAGTVNIPKEVNVAGTVNFGTPDSELYAVTISYEEKGSCETTTKSINLPTGGTATVKADDVTLSGNLKLENTSCSLTGLVIPVEVDSEETLTTAATLQGELEMGGSISINDVEVNVTGTASVPIPTGIEIGEDCVSKEELKLIEKATAKADKIESTKTITYLSCDCE